MMARRNLLGVLAGGIALALSGCGLFRGDAEVRYRVTVEVLDQSEIRSGSSVWSWTLREPDVALASAYDGEFRGEAVAIDLSGGRTLFAILRSKSGESGVAAMLPERVFGDIGRVARGEKPLFGGDRIADLRDIASRQGEARTLDCSKHPDWCPMLVSFADPDDPASVRQGAPGLRLSTITVGITDDPVTTGIEERLGWLSEYYSKRLSGKRFDDGTDLATSLSAGVFAGGTLK